MGMGVTVRASDGTSGRALGLNDVNSLHLRSVWTEALQRRSPANPARPAALAAFGCRRHRCAHASVCAGTNCPSTIALEMQTRDISTTIGRSACPLPLIDELFEGVRQWVG